MSDQFNKYSAYAGEVNDFGGGKMYTASAAEFPALRGLSLQSLHLDPGGVRELHVHPNAAQMDFTVVGSGVIGLVAPGGRTQLLEMSSGDVSFIPHGYGHWIENPGDETLHMLLIVNHEDPETLFLSDLLRALPADTLERSYGASGVSALISTKER